MSSEGHIIDLTDDQLQSLTGLFLQFDSFFLFAILKLLINFKNMAEDTQTTEIPKGKQIGKITHFFNKIGVGVIELQGELKVGDTIVITGHGKEFEQNVDSMQVEHEQVNEAKSGDAVGLKVDQPVKEGDLVYLKG